MVSTARGIHTQSSSEHLGSFALYFLASASSTAAPSDKLAAVRMEGIKGEVTVMSRAACFPLSQLRTCTSAGQVWLRSGVRPLPDSTLTPRWARWLNSTSTLCKRLWQVTTSPPRLQAVAWLPRRSRAMPGHKEHEEPLAMSRAGESRSEARVTYCLGAPVGPENTSRERGIPLEIGQIRVFLIKTTSLI